MMLTPQENLCLYLQLLVMLQHVNPQVDDTGKSQLPPKSKRGPGATLLINWLCQSSVGLDWSAHSSREFCAGHPDWCNVLGFGWGECPDFRQRVFSCLCPLQPLIVGLQSDAGISSGPNPDLLHRNELQHEPVVKSALAGHCWGSGKQHLLMEWPWTCEQICTSEGCTIRHILLWGKKRVTALAQEKAASSTHHLCLVGPLLSKSAPAPALWYQYNIDLPWANITS